MSRTGRKVIPIPEKVKVSLQDGVVHVEGPLGKLTKEIPATITVQIEGKEIQVKRGNDLPGSRALHGLTRSLVANMVQGVTAGFKRELDIEGVGYRAEVKGKILNLSLGFSKPVEFPIPEGIKIAVDKQTHVVISGHDKALVGLVTADLRKLRPPEPYKGKGIRFTGEKILRKAGKAAAGAGAK